MKFFSTNKSMAKDERGLTLIETIIYTAILSLIIIAFVVFSLSISSNRNNAYAAQEVQTNVRTALNLMSQRIRAATGINISESTFNTDPGYLSLEMASSTLNPTIISLTEDNGAIAIKEGSNATTTITTDEVVVSNLIFRQRGGGSPRANIQIEIDARYRAEVTSDFAYNQSVETSVTLRQ